MAYLQQGINLASYNLEVILSITSRNIVSVA